MKLIIQIPCKNEQDTLLETFAEFPKKIDGIDTIEYQVINDGSTDNTVEVAKKLWVHHIIEFKKNRGLGNAFRCGVQNALRLGADIVVNTDADNQYPGRYISDLVKPIISGEADIVIGDRQPTKIKHFSWYKKILQRLGNIVVSYAAGQKLPDSVSGFRAYSREALMEINVTSRFSYVIDTIIQACKKGLKITWIPITTNLPTRPSRLFKNIFVHIKKSTIDILRIYTMYEPLKVLLMMAIPFLVIGWLGIFRFVAYYFLTDLGREMIQSLIICGVLITIGSTLFALGIIADLLAKNRFLIEEQLTAIKKEMYKK